jgi:hypothetical protein
MVTLPLANTQLAVWLGLPPELAFSSRTMLTKKPLLTPKFKAKK